MLSSVPSREKKKPRSYTVPLLVACISMLIIALSGISGLYYFESQTDPTVIVINETPNETNDQTLTVQKNTTKTTSNTNKNKTNKSTKTTNKKSTTTKRATNST